MVTISTYATSRSKVSRFKRLSVTTNNQTKMTDCSNRRSGVALAMRHRRKWFIHLPVHGLKIEDEHPATLRIIGRVSYIRIYLCYFCFRWKTVSLVQASMQHLMHHVAVSLQQSKITLQNNCINNTSITQPTLSFYLWLKCRICNFHANYYD